MHRLQARWLHVLHSWEIDERAWEFVSLGLVLVEHGHHAELEAMIADTSFNLGKGLKEPSTLVSEHLLGPLIPENHVSHLKFGLDGHLG